MNRSASGARASRSRQWCRGTTLLKWCILLGMLLLLTAARVSAQEAETPAGNEDAATETAEPAEEPAGPPEAMAPIRGEGSDRYFSTGWLIALCLFCAAWIGVFDWIGRDSERWKLRPILWGTLALSIGAGGALLLLFIDIALVFLGLPALLILLGVYIYLRNKHVPPDMKVFTPAHIRSIFRRIGVKLHIIKATGGGFSGGEGDMTEIALLRKDGTTLEKIAEGQTSARTSEAVMSVKELVESAVLSRATDIHLEPKEGELQARFRIDGILHNVPSYPPELAAPMISSVKVLSDMDIAERRKPQDGTFMGRLGARTLDFRVSTTPSVHGETMVVRILDRETGLISIDKLGFNSRDMESVKRIINAPHGMMIAAGPTGSGKTTTLYAMISELDAFQKNIITIEDPIEYRLENVTQTQVNPKAGVTFAGQLRSMLRQDPDVIFVGEIRDAETARTALQSSMTGHFVFTTLHANDSITSLFRLLDLGVEPYLISASLYAVLAQRLVRVLCPKCKEAYIPEPEFLEKLGIKTKREIQLYRQTGCDYCQGTGYYGRIGIFELLEVNDTIRDLIRSNPSVQLITAEARKNGMRRLQEDGLAKVLKGYTSVKELLRVTR